MEKLIADFIARRTWAVVGATQDVSKYGYKIFRDLRGAGYHVYGINPKGGKIDDQPLYETLDALKDKVNLKELVVDIVVPPPVTEKIVQTCKELGIKRIWMQPGSQSETAIKYCQDNNLDCVYDACAMIKKRTWDDASRL